MYFELDNDGMELSKHCPVLKSLIFIPKCYKTLCCQKASYQWKNFKGGNLILV